VLTLGGTNATSISASSLQITNLANGSSAQHAAAFGQIATAVNAAVSGTTNALARFTGTNAVGDSGVTDDGTTVGTTRLVQITKAAIGTTATIGLDLYNSTNSGTQYSPMERWSAWNGSTQVNFGVRWEPQSTSRGKWVFYTGTGSGAPSGGGSTTYWDSQDATFGEGWISTGFYSGSTSSGGSGFRFKHSNNNGGLKYRSSDDAIYLTSYGTKPVDIETGADSGGSGGVIRLHIAGDGSGYIRFVPTAPTSSSNALTINLTTSQHADHTLTENTTVTITGGANGQRGTIVFSQPASAKTVTMPTNGVGVEYDNAIAALTTTGIVDATNLTRTLLAYRILSNGKAFIYARSVALIP
jgi:hypothetical protein